MSSELTVEAVRTSLGMYQLQARVASTNIANASRPGAQAMRVDLTTFQSVLADMANGSAETAVTNPVHDALREVVPVATGLPINLDAEVAQMAAATTQFHALTEALSRQFGLMRLAISGRG